MVGGLFLDISCAAGARVIPEKVGVEEVGGGSPEQLHLCISVCLSVIWGMPLDVMIAPAEDCFWPDLQETNMRLKIRVRRMKEGRELRGVYPHERMRYVCFCVNKCMTPSLLCRFLSRPHRE